MKIISDSVDFKEIEAMVGNFFADMVKAVVDIDRELIALDAGLHSDLEKLLLENGSSQESLWGINFYPGFDEADFVEFDSMINLRLWQGNKTRGVDDLETQKKILAVVKRKILR